MHAQNKQAAEDKVNMGKSAVVKRDDYEEEDDHEKYYKLLQVCVWAGSTVLFSLWKKYCWESMEYG